MLGKGLESLIPRKGNQNPGGQGSGTDDYGIPPVFLPVGDSMDDPARSLPVVSEELELPAPPEEKEITRPAAQNELSSAEEDYELLEPDTLPASDSPAVPLPAASALRNPVSGTPAVFAHGADSAIASVFSAATVAAAAGASRSSKKKDDQVQESIFHIEVDRIAPNPGQPRRHFDEAALRELANSIREFGFIQPLVVTKKEIETPAGIDVSYELIAGERRLNAAKLLGLPLVPAIVRKVNLEREKIELAIIENIQREALNPIETARAFQRLQEEFRMTQREIAAKLGKSRETVANSVRLLDLPAYIQEALQKGALSESHGRLLLAIDDPAAQKKLFDDIALRGLTTRDVKERVRIITKRPRAGGVHDITGGDLTPELKAMQDHLSAALGAPVEIHQGAANGKIMITFYSEEELDNILRRLGTEE